MSHSTIVITGGEYKGQRLRFPLSLQKTTRPTLSRVREAIFSMVAHYFGLEDGTFDGAIDLCAGTGALGIEALSRGVHECTFVDKDPRVTRALIENLQRFKVPEDRYDILTMDAEKFLRKAKITLRQPLFFCDPPYKTEPNAWLECIGRSPLWKPGAALVMEVGAENKLALEQLPEGLFFDVVVCKEYSNAQIWILRYGS